MQINFMLNGEQRQIDVDPGRRVIDVLREDFGLTGSKEACSSGECGACSILVQGQSRLSCLMLACQLQGQEVVTVEGLARANGELHPLQQAFVSQGAVQCGFCSPGMLIAAADLLARQPQPDRDEIRAGLSGNLCRCTGYQKIVNAVDLASRHSVNHSEIIKENSPDYEISAGSFSMNPDLWRKAERAERAEPADRGDPGEPGGGPQKQRFEQIYEPHSLEELLHLRQEHPQAVLVAGGTDLLVWLCEGRRQAGSLIMTAQVPELQAIKVNHEEAVIGAGVTLQTLLEHHDIKVSWPLLIQALQALGSPPIRHMATLAGNICSASPAGDSLPALHVMGASLDIASRRKQRQVAVADFICGPGKTDLQDDECVIAIRIPRPAPGWRSGFVKVGQRQALAIAVASLAYGYTCDSAGRVAQMKLAWGSVGPKVMCFPEIEAAFEGRELDRVFLDALAPRVAALVQPIDDVRASASYRRLVAGRLLHKLLLPADYAPEQ